MCADYTIEEHQHRLSAWAASRAASVKGCRFHVKKGRCILENGGFDASFSFDKLPSLNKIDSQHKEWRKTIIKSAKREGLQFSHGVAAKLISCYLKVRFVCAGKHRDLRVQNLHPPVDRQLLKSLEKEKIGGYQKEWLELKDLGWSNFKSKDYSRVIRLIRKSLKGQPLWKIEKYWEGHQ